jgi:hypothetical protein
MRLQSIIEFCENYAEAEYAHKNKDYKYYQIEYNWQYLNDNKHVIGVIINITGLWHILYFNKPVIKERVYNPGEFFIHKKEIICIYDPTLVHIPDPDEYAKTQQQKVDNVYKSFAEYKNKFNRFPEKITIDCLPDFNLKFNDKFEYIEKDEKDVNISIKK